MSTIGGVGSWQQPQPYSPPTFSQLDQNSDGSISLAEFEADAPDGSSGSGASAATQNAAEALFNKIDTNGDGSISSSEFSTFQSQMSQQQSAQNFLTQLVASGQSGASGTGAAGSAHHGGHHHHGGGMSLLDDSSSTDGTDGTSSTDGSDSSTDPLTMIEDLLNNTPTDGSTGDSTGSRAPADLLTAANNAYASSSTSNDLWSSLSNVLQDAA
jgi:EF-hand domain pair